jgi:ABC-type transport system involved in multi-copper enzyme maturation permease subunit
MCGPAADVPPLRWPGPQGRFRLCSADLSAAGLTLSSKILNNSTGGAPAGFTRVLYYLVPNFHNFNAIEAAGHSQFVPFSLIWQNTLYTILYAAIVLVAASAIFSRRNLK